MTLLPGYLMHFQQFLLCEPDITAIQLQLDPICKRSQSSVFVDNINLKMHEFLSVIVIIDKYTIPFNVSLLLACYGRHYSDLETLRDICHANCIPAQVKL